MENDEGKRKKKDVEKDWKLWVSCRVSGSRCVEGKVQGTYTRLQIAAAAAGKALGKEKHGVNINTRLDDKRWTCAAES